MKCAAIVAALAASGKAMPGTTFSYDDNTSGGNVLPGKIPDPNAGYYVDTVVTGTGQGVPAPAAGGVISGQFDPTQWTDPSSWPSGGQWVDDDDSDDDDVVDVYADTCTNQVAADIWSCIDWSNVVGEACVPTTTTTTVTVDDYSCTSTEYVQQTVTETCSAAATATETTTVPVDCGDVVVETICSVTSTDCVNETIIPTITENKYDYVLTIVHPQVSITETVSACVATTEYSEVVETYYPTDTVYDSIEVCVPTTSTVYDGIAYETTTVTVYDAPVYVENWVQLLVPVGCVEDADYCPGGVSPGTTDPWTQSPVPPSGQWVDPNTGVSPGTSSPYSYDSTGVSPAGTQGTQSY